MHLKIQVQNFFLFKKAVCVTAITELVVKNRVLYSYRKKDFVKKYLNMNIGGLIYG